MTTLTTRTARSLAEKLIALERQERRWYAILERGTKERTRLREDITRLRLALTQDEADFYEMLTRKG